MKAAAQQGFAAGEAYHAHRPTYSATAVQTLLTHVRVASKTGARLLDLGAGTGKLTEALVARQEEYVITAVEPHEAMRRVLVRKQLSRVETIDGTGEKIPVEDESVDAVVVGQAFHWFANMTSLQEIHRVLQSHGALGMIWNIDDYNSPQSFEPRSGWERKLHELVWTLDDGEPRFRHGKWRQVFDDQLKSTPLPMLIASKQYFALPIGEEHEDYVVWLSREAIWERVATLSQIAVLEGEERERMQTTVLDMLEAEGVEINSDGNIALHGKTYIVWTTKIPEEGRDSLVGVERTS